MSTTPVQAVLRRYGTGAALAALAAAAVCVLLGRPDAARGVVLGALASVANFLLMARGLPARVAAGSKRRSVARFFSSLLFRYLVLAVPLYLALRLEAFAFFPAVGGLFCVQAVILADHVVGTRLKAIANRQV
ncbi:MAG: ATP synthase subunit I [Deltaproteobacteria bacterium]|nr:ATP synthase subunit I [Deltaproteobacteria bacterium]